MSYKDVRKGMTQAKVNEDLINIFMLEVLIISIGAGIYTKSWWVFGGLFFGLILGIAFKRTAIAIGVVLTIAWGIIGWMLGGLFDNTGAQWVLSIMGLLISAGVHRSAFEWTSDLDNE